MIQDNLSTLHQTSYKLGLQTSHPVTELGSVPCKVKLCSSKYAYAILDQPTNITLQVNFVGYANLQGHAPKSRFAGYTSHNPPPQFSVVRFPINYRERFSIVSIGTANPRREGSHSLGATTFNIVPQFIALSLIIKKMKRKDIKCRC